MQELVNTTDQGAQFEARVMRQLKSKRLFPWHRWCAVIDQRIAPECAALDGRVWAVDDPNLIASARDHFGLNLPACGCTGMAMRTNNQTR